MLAPRHGADHIAHQPPSAQDTMLPLMLVECDFCKDEHFIMNHAALWFHNMGAHFQCSTHAHDINACAAESLMHQCFLHDNCRSKHSLTLQPLRCLCTGITAYIPDCTLNFVWCAQHNQLNSHLVIDTHLLLICTGTKAYFPISSLPLGFAQLRLGLRGLGLRA